MTAYLDGKNFSADACCGCSTDEACAAIPSTSKVFAVTLTGLAGTLAPANGAYSLSYVATPSPRWQWLEYDEWGGVVKTIRLVQDPTWKLTVAYVVSINEYCGLTFDMGENPCGPDASSTFTFGVDGCWCWTSLNTSCEDSSGATVLLS